MHDKAVSQGVDEKPAIASVQRNPAVNGFYLSCPRCQKETLFHRLVISFFRQFAFSENVSQPQAINNVSDHWILCAIGSVPSNSCYSTCDVQKIDIAVAAMMRITSKKRIEAKDDLAFQGDGVTDGSPLWPDGTWCV